MVGLRTICWRLPAASTIPTAVLARAHRSPAHSTPTIATIGCPWRVARGGSSEPLPLNRAAITQPIASSVGVHSMPATRPSLSTTTIAINTRAQNTSARRTMATSRRHGVTISTVFPPSICLRSIQVMRQRIALTGITSNRGIATQTTRRIHGLRWTSGRHVSWTISVCGTAKIVARNVWVTSRSASAMCLILPPCASLGIFQVLLIHGPCTLSLVMGLEDIYVSERLAAASST
mmetsp:Transcript_24511/g.80014  ORF Transcript_24511/g.80014 Transcript_24511/m.80014 type:complete len:234 (-) Transcript_24511:1628-2329(-)